MQKKDHYDYIIVGQGLGGSVLSYHLIRAGLKVLVFDDDQPLTPSRIAAGLFNPVTGRKMVKTWAADLLFPYLIPFYRELENNCGESFFFETPIYRPFTSFEEQNEWMGKSVSNEFIPYINKIYQESRYGFSNDKYGGIELKCSGYLNVRAFLTAYRRFLVRKEALQTLKFNIDDLTAGEQEVVYKQYRARRIIFCDGLQAQHNPLFNWLPFRPVKGEILKIKSDMPLKNILNRGVFVIPIEEQRFRVGSTYDNNDLTTEITAKARHEITRKLNELLDAPYTIVEQEAGIRPATKDRRPFIGMHPEYKTIGVLNGLGTKGVSLAPYFAKQFVEYLESGNELHPEVNITRYFSLYYDSVKVQ